MESHVHRLTQTQVANGDYSCTLCFQNFKRFHGFINCHNRTFSKSPFTSVFLPEMIRENVPGMYQCDLCSVTKADKKQLVDHRKIHFTGINTWFKCSFLRCRKIFSDKESFLTHLQHHYRKQCGPTMEYKCSFCSEVFKNLKQILLHIPTHSNATLITPNCVDTADDKSVEIVDNRVTCNVCYRTYKSEVGLGCHAVTCRNCKLVVNACELKQHEKQHEAKVLSRHDCDNSADDPLKDHVKIVQSSLPFVKDCGKMFSTEDSSEAFSMGSLEVPARAFNFEPESSEESSKVQKDTQSLGASETLDTEASPKNLNGEDFLEEHQDVSGDEQPPVERESSKMFVGNSNPEQEKYRCGVCGASFQSLLIFKMHEDVHTKIGNFVCGTCGEDFPEEDLFRQHMLTHNRIECSECGQVFPNKLQLKIHLYWKHEKKFRCEPCEEAYRCREELDRHLETCPKKVKYFVCFTCGGNFREENLLQQHMLTHFSHTCSECGEGFTSNNQLKVHTNLRHKKKCEHSEVDHLKTCPKTISENRKTFVCDTCGERSLQEDQLQQHMLAHAANKCAHCGEVFSRSFELKLHMNVTHNKKYKCVPCEEAYSSIEDLDRHLEACPKRVCGKVRYFVCDTCGGSFLEENLLQQHMLIHFNRKCSECGEVFTTKLLLKAHMNSKHQKKYKCEHCEVECRLKQDLQLHLKTCSKKAGENGKNFVCATCGEDSLQEDQFRQHVLAHASNKCAHCGEVFKRNLQLKVHMNATHNKKYKCVPCEAAFKSKRELDRHLMKCLKGEAKYVCEVCGKTFILKDSFDFHLKTHASEKNVVCEHCGKRFLSKSYLNTHLMVHTDSKSFKCSVCDKAFKNGKNLKRHLMWHTGQKPYKCEICHKQCIQKVNLKRHVCKPQV